ncbi:MAG: ATP-binding cassette domain-containing protein [Gammaproteobacteria bacterium]|nr:ATP-binding cassette domain-containing protein [Gammaproteobacteria bacterium]
MPSGRSGETGWSPSSKRTKPGGAPWPRWRRGWTNCGSKGRTVAGFCGRFAPTSTGSGAILAAEAVQFDGVAKAFAGVPVLDGVNLSFPAGLTTAVVGESGSGKTTLLQLINGVLQPDAGQVRVFGEAVPRQAVEPFRRRIGYAVQGAGLFPHLTNRQNVVLLAQLEGWTQDAIEARYAELLEEMDLPEEVSRRYPHQLSGGQQQRVGLCRALMLKPGLLLLDEPFSAVDPITRVGIYERFEFVQRHEGVSTVLVTHDMREAVHLGDRLVILRAGQVVRSGTTDEVVNAPGDAYVEQLVNQQL